MALADSRPRVNPSVVLAAVDDGYLAFDTGNERLHRLNPVAALVLEMCDGTRDLTAVRDALLPLIGGAGGAGWTACQRWIETARRDHLCGVCLSEARGRALTGRPAELVSTR